MTEGKIDVNASSEVAEAEGETRGLVDGDGFAEEDPTEAQEQSEEEQRSAFPDDECYPEPAPIIPERVEHRAAVTGGFLHKDPSFPAWLRSQSVARKCKGFGSRMGRCTSVVEGLYVCEECEKLLEFADPDRSFSAAIQSIPERYRWATRTSSKLIDRVWGAGNAVRAVMQEIESESRWIFIYGASQSGKTSLACAAMRDVIQQAMDSANDRGKQGRASMSRFYTSVQLARARALWARSRTSDNEAPEVSLARRCRLLVLDDLGLEHDPRVCIELLHERHSRNLQTIVTTNIVEPEEIQSRYGSPIRERLVRGVCVPLERSTGLQ